MTLITFTGTLDSMNRSVATTMAVAAGLTVKAVMHEGVDYLIQGQHVSPRKVDKAKALGVRCLNEEEFLNLLGGRKPVVVSAEDKVLIKAWDSIMRKLGYADTRDTTAILTDDEARLILAKIKDD